jgi:aspartyl-tRNA(Asn)/glutamyl-tRNA(Gln) amidotransferase subunit A
LSPQLTTRWAHATRGRFSVGSAAAAGSGAGAGAAAGYGPLHIGTDIGGSIRLPAGWCGLVGFKPSNGRVPIDPPYYGRVAGPMTRTVADAALMMDVLCRPDRRDHMSLPFRQLPWGALDADLTGLRIGLQLDAGVGLTAEPPVAAAIEQAARAFENAGAIVEPMRPFMTNAMTEGIDRFWRARAWADIGPLADDLKARILPFILSWAQGGAGLDGQQVFQGFSQMYAMRAASVAGFEPFDFVLSPTAPMPAFAAELPCPTNDPSRPFEHIYFTVPYNMSEQPAVSINAGYTADGLPIGLQIIGQRFDDMGVLRLARSWEKMRPAQRPWPM